MILDYIPCDDQQQQPFLSRNRPKEERAREGETRVSPSRALALSCPLLALGLCFKYYCFEKRASLITLECLMISDIFVRTNSDLKIAIVYLSLSIVNVYI